MKSHKKNILIFTESFLPPAYLPRVRYFCTYFADKGWDVNVVSESPEYQELTHENIKTFTIDYYKHSKGIFSKIEWITKFILNLIWDYKGYYFKKKSKTFIGQKKFDLVFSSSHFAFPITTAAKVAKEMNIPLFVDLRDIPEQAPNDSYYIANTPPKLFGRVITHLYKKINLKRRNKVLKKAEGVTTVSEWHVNVLSKYNPKTYLIYNGFDENRFVQKKMSTNRFILSYFGRIYSEKMRNPKLIFDVIESLHNKKLISAQDFLVEWYVDEKSKNVLQNILKDYNLDDFIEIQDFIPPEELPDKMNKSSILLIISTSKDYFGIMTTKLFESIGINKSILCYPDNDDELSHFIKKNNCGTISSDTQEIEQFILNKYSEWKKNGYLEGTIDDNHRMDFSRKKGAEFLENLFLNSIKNQ